MREYLVRAQLEFDWDFEQVGKAERLRSPKELPITIGPFCLYDSPNAEFYLHRVAQIELEHFVQQNPDWRYPISLLYFEIKLEESKQSRPYAQAEDKFELLECLLRLFQPGGISVRRHEHIFLVQEHSFSPFVYLTGHQVKPLPAPTYERPAYPFDDGVLSEFIEFFNAHWDVLQGNPSSPLKMAASRFSSSYEKRTLSDRLIDLVIALEALFGDGDSRGIAARVATRCACLLNLPEEECSGTIGLVRKSYAERNKILHGGQRERRLMQPVQLLITEAEVAELEDIVRKSMIAAMINSSKSSKGSRVE